MSSLFKWGSAHFVYIPSSKTSTRSHNLFIAFLAIFHHTHRNNNNKNNKKKKFFSNPLSREMSHHLFYLMYFSRWWMRALPFIENNYRLRSVLDRHTKQTAFTSTNSLGPCRALPIHLLLLQNFSTGFNLVRCYVYICCYTHGFI